jgi:nitroreductase
MQAADLAGIVATAALAPSVHNIQPARWAWRDGAILLAADRRVGLPAADPAGRDIGLSLGAALEATVLALSARGLAADVTETWAARDEVTLPGCRLAAVIRTRPGGGADPLAAVIAARFTHRGGFRPGAAAWTSDRAVMVHDPVLIRQLAHLHDRAGLAAMRQQPVRAELLSWLRLWPWHPRRRLDGMAAPALRMGWGTALAAAVVLGPLWPLADRVGLAAAVTAEARKTVSAGLIALVHQPRDEGPVAAGRAWFRVTLQAAARGLAIWPMAALTDDPQSRAALMRLVPLPPGQVPVQALRLGLPDAPPPPRARRPPAELILP